MSPCEPTMSSPGRFAIIPLPPVVFWATLPNRQLIMKAPSDARFMRRCARRDLADERQYALAPRLPVRGGDAEHALSP